MNNNSVKYNDQSLSVFSRVFSPRIIQDLSKKGKSKTLSRIALEAQNVGLIQNPDTVEDFFEASYKLLQKESFRHEYMYKSAIAQKILMGVHSLKTAVMINEFRVCNNKADCVIFNGTSTVYEIKTERDTVARLKQQVESYRKVFASVNVISGKNHLEKVLDIIPEDVGVLVLSDRNQISTMRKSLDNPARTDVESIFNAIRIDEAKKILRSYGFEIPDVPNTRMYGCLLNLFRELDSISAHNGMVDVLRTTRSHIPIEELIRSLPVSLHSIAISTQIRKQDHERFMASLKTPINEVIKWN